MPTCLYLPVYAYPSVPTVCAYRLCLPVYAYLSMPTHLYLPSVPTQCCIETPETETYTRYQFNSPLYQFHIKRFNTFQYVLGLLGYRLISLGETIVYLI